MKRFRFTCTLMFLACSLAAADADALAPVSATTGSVADAMVTTGPSDGPLGDWNYGGGGSLSISGAAATRVGVTPAERGTAESYMRFNVAAAKTAFDTAYGANGWAVKSVTLQVTQGSANNPVFNDQHSGTFSIHWIADDSWVEGTGQPMLPTQNGITYNTRPTGQEESAGSDFAYVNPSTTVTYSLAVGSLLATDIESGGLMSLRIFATDQATSDMSFTFNSRSQMNVANRPVLTINAVLAALGDMDGDGHLTNFDIAPFELALTDSNAYQLQYPAVTNWQDRGDTSGDSTINNFDIQPFEQLLTSGFGSTAAVPEPGSACLLVVGLAIAGIAAHLRRRTSPLPLPPGEGWGEGACR